MMALPRKVLLKKATKLELKGLETNKLEAGHLSDLDKLLDEVYTTRRPGSADYHNRTDLIRIFNIIAKEIYGNFECPIVEGFGSFIMDMFNTESDLDLSINFGRPEVELRREKKIEALKKFSKKLHFLQRQGHVTGIQTITSARVPIVKVIDIGTQIECDLSVENWDGIRKSQIVHIITSIDERFKKLSFLVKTWAKANGINSSKDRTLNSLSIISLVAFHLQTRNPPILPPFSLLFKDGTDTASVRNSVNNFLNYGKSNKECVSVLFVTLLIKLASVEKLWQKGLCASLYTASWMSKSWDSQCSPMSVEDFTSRSENVARAVGLQETKTIYNCIHNSIRYLHNFCEGKLEGDKLTQLLFGSADGMFVPGAKRPIGSGGPHQKKKKKQKRKKLNSSGGGSFFANQPPAAPSFNKCDDVDGVSEADVQVLVGLIVPQQPPPTVPQNRILGFGGSHSVIPGCSSSTSTPSWPDTSTSNSRRV